MKKVWERRSHAFPPHCTLGCQIETTREYNKLSPGTAQVTTAETGCDTARMSYRLRVFEPCRCAPGMSHTLVCQIETTGIKFTQHWNSAADNCKAVCANVSSNTRAVENIHMAHTFGLEST